MFALISILRKDCCFSNLCHISNTEKFKEKKHSLLLVRRMPLLLWVKGEGAADAEAFRVEVTPSASPPAEPAEGAASSSSGNWWLHASEPSVGDVLDAAVKMFFPARGSTGRSYNVHAFQLWLQKRRLTDFNEPASAVIDAALKRALDVTPTVSNRTGTMDQFMLQRRQGVVFELRLPASPFSNTRSQKGTAADATQKKPYSSGNNIKRQCDASSPGVSSPPRLASPRVSHPTSTAISRSHSPPGTPGSTSTSGNSGGGDEHKPPPALVPISATGAAMWIPKAQTEKFLPGKACSAFLPRWGAPNVCQTCFEHVSSHAHGAPLRSTATKELLDAHYQSPSTPRTPLNVLATPRQPFRLFSATSPVVLLGAASSPSPSHAAPSAAAVRSVYTKTCAHFLPLWDHNNHCSTCYRPLHWHDSYLRDLAEKRHQYVSGLRQHSHKEQHQKLMALLPWHHVYHYLSIEDILACACVSRVCALTARVLLKSIMTLVVKYEAPGDMRMRILRDADRIATALDTSRMSSFATIYPTKVLVALLAACNSSDDTNSELLGPVVVEVPPEYYHNESSISLATPPAGAVQRRSIASKRRTPSVNHTKGIAPSSSRDSDVSRNRSDESASPLQRGDTATPTGSTSVAGSTSHNSPVLITTTTSSRIPSLIAVIHTLLQIEPEDLSHDAVTAIKDIPRPASQVTTPRARSGTEHTSFRDRLVYKYATKSPPAQTLDSTSDNTALPSSVLQPLVNYLNTLAHLRHMKTQATRYLQHPTTTL